MKAGTSTAADDVERLHLGQKGRLIAQYIQHIKAHEDDGEGAPQGSRFKEGDRLMPGPRPLGDQIARRYRRERQS